MTIIGAGAASFFLLTPFPTDNFQTPKINKGVGVGRGHCQHSYVRL